MSKLFLGSIFFTLTLSNVYADAAKFVDIKMQGRGCKTQSSAVVFSPDNTSASVLFDELIVQVPTGGMDDFSDSDVTTIQKRIDRSVCNMTVKLEVPSDERVVGVEFQTDFRGVAAGEYGTEAEIDSRIISWNDSLRGSKTSSSLIFNKLFRDDFDVELFESNSNYISVDSSCKTSKSTVDFVIRNTLRAEIVRRTQDAPSAVLAIDSSDMNGNFKIKLHTLKCGNTRPTNPNRPTRPTRPGGRDRADRTKIELCAQMGGVWHEAQRTCIQVFGRR